MKILILHNSYKFKGGEDKVVENEYLLLKKKNKVSKIIRKNSKEINNIFDNFNVALNLNYSKKSINIIYNKVKKFKPDIVHVHNIFPLWSSSIIDFLNYNKIPIIMTLHNYRFICSNANFIRNEKLCFKCIHKNNFYGVIHSCYQNSMLKSYALYRYQEYLKNKNFFDKINKFIVFSKYSKKIFSKYIDPKKIFIKPNFILEKKILKKNNSEKYFLFVGRISKEKGLDLIFNHLSKFNIKIKIVGTGPLLTSEIKKLDNDKIEILGMKNEEEIFYLMKNAVCLLFTSQCIEGMPLVVLESLSVGLPVVITQKANVSNIIINNYNGIVFNSEEKNIYTYANKILNDNILRRKLSINALKSFKKNYSSKVNYEKMIYLYKKVIDENK
jgi:glycosyltransferase involved in cell wall biosynthesis